MSFMGFLPVNYRLEPSQSVMLGLADARAPTGRQASFRLKLEEVIRQYNWPMVTEQFKLLITTSPLADMTLAFLNLKALPSPPILSDLLKPMADRGAFDIDTDEADSLPEWSTQTITLKLVNPLYNKVQLDELRQMLEPTTLIDNIMADFALGLYLESDKVDSMHPSLKLRESLYVIDHKEGQRGLWNDFTVSVANKAAQWSQNRQYRHNLIRYPDRVRIVAEGDSWFQYPFLLRDIVDYISGVYTVFSVAASGATLDDYLKKPTFLEAIGQVKPAFFLLSGGGTDLLGESFGDYFLNAPTANLSGPERYLSPAFTEKLATIGKQYGRIFRLVQQVYPQVRVLVHGYDYMIPTDISTKQNRADRLGKTMLQKGIVNQSDREAVVRHIIDAFNTQLRQVVSSYQMVTYLDLRNTIRRTDKRTEYWYDEIHPNDKGFLSLSSRFIDAITPKKVALPSPSGLWSEEFLWAKRKQGDPVADHVITTLLAQNQKGEIDTIFQMLVRNRQFPNPAFDVLPDEVKQVVEGYFLQTRQMPAYADSFKLMIATDVFRMHGPKILLILLCKSLPLCYTCWRGAKYYTERGGCGYMTARWMPSAVD